MASIEIRDEWDRTGRTIQLEGEEMVVGRNPDCDVVVDPDDKTMSRYHLVLERVGRRWAVIDTMAVNGTYVNKERVISEQMLCDGDVIGLGRSRLVYRNRAEQSGATTEPVAPLPKLTRREFHVLRELVRPKTSGNAFTPPAKRAEIANALHTTESAVQNHLSNMYLKFDIPEGEDRRLWLAEEAYNRGAITMADLRDPDPEA